MICCVSRAKIHFEGRKIYESFSFWLFFSIFWFLWFFMILRVSGYEFRLPGLISCPGQVPNRPGVEFQANSDFRVHMVFMFRPCEPQCSVARPPQNLKPRWGESFFILVWKSELGVLIEFSNFKHNSKHHQNFQKLALQGAVGALEANLPTSCPAPPYYSISSISKGYKLYESSRLTEPGKMSLVE